MSRWKKQWKERGMSQVEERTRWRQRGRAVRLCQAGLSHKESKSLVESRMETDTD